MDYPCGPSVITELLAQDRQRETERHDALKNQEEAMSQEWQWPPETIEGNEMESSVKPVEGTILADTLILAQRK